MELNLDYTLLLARIAALLRRASQLLVNDSQASICIIAKYMDSQQILQQCKYKVLLEGHSSPTSCPRKKRPANQNSESEVPYRMQGNKEAHKLATAATDPSECSRQYGIGHEGLQGFYWPVQTEIVNNQGKDAAKS